MRVEHLVNAFKAVDPPDLRPPTVDYRPRPNPYLQKAQAEIRQVGVREGIERTLQQLEEMIESLNYRMERSLKTKNLRFRIHEGTDRVIVSLVEQDSGKVIREYPPEKLLHNAKILKEVTVIDSIVG